MATPEETAAARFDQGFNCAQAVFSAFATQLGLEEKAALKLASPFGGGVARRGSICGAVSGALMAFGLVHGAETPAGKEEIYRRSQELLRRFEEKHGSILCRDLIGCDLSTPAGRQEAAEKGVSRSICPGLVREAAGIAREMLAEG